MSRPQDSIFSLLSRRQPEEIMPLSHVSLEGRPSSQIPLTSSHEQHYAQDSDCTHIHENSRPFEKRKLATRLRTIKRIPIYGWWWETAAIAIALMSIGAIAAVLAYANGQQPRDWKYSIQPASLVSIFSTIAKSALIVPLAASLSQLKWRYFDRPQALSRMQDFDDASRGPWGAMIFLWNVKGTALLASLASAATLLMLAFEPFTQQVINFNTVSVMVDPLRDTIAPPELLPAFISGTSAWSDWSFQYGAEQGFAAPYAATIEMMAALAGRPTTFQNNTFCPNTQCLFDDFTTLGVCSACESETLLADESFDCKYYVRQGSTAAGEETNYTDRDLFINATEDGLKHNTTTSYGMNCTHKKQGFPAIGLVLHVNIVNNDTTVQGLGQQKSHASANLSSAAIFGDTSSVVLETGDSISPKDPFHKGAYRFCTSGLGRRDLGGMSEDFDTISTFTCFLTTSRVIYDIPQDRRVKLNDFNATATHCRLSFCAQEYTNTSIRNGTLEMSPIIPGKLIRKGEDLNDTLVETAPNSKGNNFKARIGRKATANLATTIDLLVYSQPIQELLYYLSDRAEWSETFDRIAKGASEYIRSNMNLDSRLRNYGRVALDLTFIHVRWAWLTLPLLLVIMVIVVLVGTIATNSGQQSPYKHSILAPLLRPLENQNKVEFDSTLVGSAADSDLRKKASGMRVRITTDNLGRRTMERSR